jgi:hypothetical protein
MLVYRFPTYKPPRRFESEMHLVVVRIYNNKLDADLARITLKAAGIESLIRGDDYGGTAPHLSFIRGIEILVRSDDAEDADAILRADASGTL